MDQSMQSEFDALLPAHSTTIKYLLDTFQLDFDLIQKEFDIGIPIIIAEYERIQSPFYVQSYPNGYVMPLFKKLDEHAQSDLHNLLSTHLYHPVPIENINIAKKLLRHVTYQLDCHTHQTTCQKIEYIIENCERQLNKGATKLQLSTIYELYDFGISLTNNIIRWGNNTRLTGIRALALLYGNEYHKNLTIRRFDFISLRALYRDRLIDVCIGFKALKLPFYVILFIIEWDSYEFEKNFINYEHYISLKSTFGWLTQSEKIKIIESISNFSTHQS